MPLNFKLTGEVKELFSELEGRYNCFCTTRNKKNLVYLYEVKTQCFASHVKYKKKELLDKYKNKYRIASARLKNWDYGSSALYYITINTKNRKHFFGEILKGEMILNDLGLKTYSEWEKSMEIRPDMNLTLGEFIVMPDHFHGIIGIGGVVGRDAKHCVSTNSTPNKFGPQSKNLGSIIRGFKSSITTFAKTNNMTFGWQPRFHDHIIRGHNEFIRITNYIKNNPKNWK